MKKNETYLVVRFFFYQKGKSNPKLAFRNVKVVVYFGFGNYNKSTKIKGVKIMTFGEKLSKLRKEYNYTQEQLADVLGVSRQSVSKWESDLTYPETDKLIEIGRRFECSMDYLLKEEITEKTTLEVSSFSKKVITAKNKRKAKKILAIVGIILGGILTVDVISMIIYFLVFGIPQ